MRLFVSCVHRDSPFCEQLVRTLETVHEVWHQRHSSVGRNWWGKIHGKIRLIWCDGFVYLLSAESIESQYCQKEYAIARDSGKPIFTIKVQSNIEIPENLLKTQMVDFSTGITLEAVALLLMKICVVEVKQLPRTGRLAKSKIGSPTHRKCKVVARLSTAIEPIIENLSRIGNLLAAGLLLSISLLMSLFPVSNSSSPESVLEFNLDTYAPAAEETIGETDEPGSFSPVSESTQEVNVAIEISDAEKTDDATYELDISKLHDKMEELCVVWSEYPDFREAIDELIERLAEENDKERKDKKRQMIYS